MGNGWNFGPNIRHSPFPSYKNKINSCTVEPLVNSQPKCEAKVGGRRALMRGQTREVFTLNHVNLSLNHISMYSTQITFRSVQNVVSY